MYQMSKVLGSRCHWITILWVIAKMDSTYYIHHFKMERSTILGGSISFHDFYEVSSMRGVYITTAVDGGTNHTMLQYCMAMDPIL